MYCLPLLSILNIGEINQLLKLQKKAIRQVFNTNYNAHCDPLFIQLNVLPITLLLQFEILKFMQYLDSYHKPNFFLQTWKSVGEVTNNYALRNSEDYYVPRLTKVEFERHPLYFFPNIWNKLDKSLNIMERKDFLKQLKAHFMDSLKNECDIPNCHICISNYQA